MDTPTLLLLVIAVALCLLAWCARELLKLAGELLTLVRIGHREARKPDVLGDVLRALAATLGPLAASLFASYVPVTPEQPRAFDWDRDAAAVRTNERASTVAFLRACAVTQRERAAYARRAEEGSATHPGEPSPEASSEAHEHAAVCLDACADRLVNEANA